MYLTVAQAIILTSSRVCITNISFSFSNAWQGISNNGTRVGIQLISGLCNGRTRANLYVEKRYNETHEFLKEYVSSVL